MAWWLWVLAIWCLLSVPAAVLLGRGIALRERDRTVDGGWSPADRGGSQGSLPLPRAEDDAATG